MTRVGIKYPALVFFLFALSSINLYAQGIHLKIHTPKDSIKINSLKGISNQNYRIKLKLPSAFFEVTKDSLKEIAHNPFIPYTGKNTSELPVVKIPPLPKIEPPLDSNKNKDRH